MNSNTVKEHISRYMKYVEISDGCWIWKGGIGGSYGKFYFSPNHKPKQVQAHVFSYLFFIGDYDRSLDLDHLCRDRRCVNPYHLEPVTRKENLARGDHNHRDKTHCRHGHEFTAGNTILYDNRRYCRECCRKRSREYMRKKSKANILLT